MSEASDYLRNLGMPSEQITALTAELDQAIAEANHLISHALRLERGTLAVAAIEGLAIRDHIDAKTPDEQHKLLSATLVRAGQLAGVVENLTTENERLEAALAVAQGRHL